MMHTIQCRRTGETIATKLDGGYCACATTEACRLHVDAAPLQKPTIPKQEAA